MSKLFKLWLPVVVWAAFIFYLSGIPSLKTNLEYDFVLRKIAHVMEYFILTFLLFRAFKGFAVSNVFYFFVYPASFSFLYAVSDEIHQLFVPGRGGSAADVAIDTLGILVFYLSRKTLGAYIKERLLCRR